MKKAVCIGINNYPGIFNDLKGCVNDANDWSELLKDLGFDVSLMLDSQATRQNIKAALQGLVDGTKAGDIAVFTYSGHGTQVTDANSDEGDPYDEALYVYDGTIIDDELRPILKGIHPQATLVVISDSCFSGSVTRIAALAAQKFTPRFVPPAVSTVGRAARRPFLMPETDMPEILITGCTDSEYSYDAEFDGRPNGAMTALALRVIRQDLNATYREFYAGLRKLLPSSDYPQTPQLEGSDANKDRELFEPLAVEPGPEPAPEPTPSPTPQPTPESPGCIAGAIRQLTRFFRG
ncbi:MAG: caspase family protein [Chloroflexi bacterium]|nr:caspase family protein [Chloroflexota bacterium]